MFRSDVGNWEKWFACAGLNMAPPLTGIDYNDAALFLQQAMVGEGLALTRRSLIGDDIARGRLVKLFDVEFVADQSYHLVCLPQQATSRKFRALRDWLKAEIDWPQ